MTKSELEDKYFHEFLVWCSSAPESTSSELIFWLDHHQPIIDNFWEWIAKCKREEL